MDDGAKESRTLQLIKRILATHDTDIDCNTCGERMECLAELILTGEQPAGALEAIQHHIENCSCCRTEYEALLSILKAERLDD